VDETRHQTLPGARLPREQDGRLGRLAAIAATSERRRWSAGVRPTSAADASCAGSAMWARTLAATWADGPDRPTTSALPRRISRTTESTSSWRARTTMGAPPAVLRSARTLSHALGPSPSTWTTHSWSASTAPDTALPETTSSLAP
jgi:hypothetical protein